MTRERSTVSRARAAGSRRTAAVLGFRDLSGAGGSAWLSTALSEMLTTELAAGGQLRTVPGEAVARMKADLSIAAAEELAGPTLDRVHEYLAADFVVVGTYAVIGSGAAEQIRLDLRIQDTSRGQTTASVAESGSVADLSGLVSRAGNRLRTDLGLSGLSDVESKAVRAASFSAVEAAQLYSEGLERMRVFEVIQAKDLFEKAARLEPESALIHAAVADAWLAMGHDRKAREAAERAIARAGGLSREDRLGIEGRAAEASKSWSEANRVYGALASFFPDDVRYSLKLAEVQTSGGKPRDALLTVRLSPPGSTRASTWPRRRRPGRSATGRALSPRPRAVSGRRRRSGRASFAREPGTARRRR